MYLTWRVLYIILSLTYYWIHENNLRKFIVNNKHRRSTFICMYIYIYIYIIFVYRSRSYVCRHILKKHTHGDENNATSHHSSLHTQVTRHTTLHTVTCGATARVATIDGEAWRSSGILIEQVFDDYYLFIKKQRRLIPLHCAS